ncbi:MAG: rhodanese-like domain-containing protein [Rhodospirillales bacterium]|nr:rhodanese-like domain-containing protein [Rhodospirillales bacterium]
MLTRGFKKLLAEANAVIETVSVADALQVHGDDDVVFVDIRDRVEREQTGAIQGAIHAPRGFLEFIADPESPMHNPALSRGKRVLLYCASGGRSTLAAKTLLDMGMDEVCHMAGGFAAWQQAGGPVEEVKP